MESLEPINVIVQRLYTASVAHARGDYGAREDLLSHCRSLIASLESPLESIQRMWWAEPARNADCRVAVDLGLFGHMRQVERDGARPHGTGVTTSELAQQAGEDIDPGMIARMMRHLAAMNVVGEVGPDTFVLLPFSRALADSVCSGAVVVSHDLISPAINYVFRYLQKNQYRYPFDEYNQPFHGAHRTLLSLEGLCEQHQLYGTALKNYSNALSAEFSAFPDPNYYPVFERLIQPFDIRMGDALLVGVGHALYAIRRVQQMFPNHPGRLIMEIVDPDIEYPAYSQNYEIIRHNIFASQPIKGARMYYCQALRGRNMADSFRILQRFREAMIPGYSILLLETFTLPETRASWVVTSMERAENAANGIAEEMETELVKMCQQAGFRVGRSYRPPIGLLVLIELDKM